MNDFATGDLGESVARAENALTAYSGQPGGPVAAEALRALRRGLLEALAAAGISRGSSPQGATLRALLQALAAKGALDPAVIAEDAARLETMGGHGGGDRRGSRGAVLWHGLAVALHHTGSKGQAVEALETSLRLDQAGLGSWLLLGDFAREAGNGEILKAAAGAAVRLAPDDPRVAALARAAAHVVNTATPAAAEAEEARLLFGQGNYAAALAKARAALEKDPRSAAAWLLMGRLALACPDGAKVAEGSLRKALEFQPGNAEIEVLLSDTLRTQDRLDEAGDRLARVLRTKPHDLRALLALARLRETENQPATAEALLRRAVQHNPHAPEAARRLGDTLKRRGKVPEALAWHWRSAGASVPEPASGPRRAVFLVQEGSLWLNMASVHEAFAADPAWEATVVAMPHFHPYCTSDEDRNGIFAFLEKEGVAYVSWDQFKLTPGCAEVVFLPSPWEIVRAPGWRTEELLGLGLRLAYIPYCFEAARDELEHASQFDQPLHQLAWAVFARSAQHKSLFARHCSVGDAHVALTGHPKLDALRRLDEAGDPGLDAFVAGRKAVCWNPHFDVVANASEFGTGYSTFMRWWRFMIEEFSRRPAMALLIRPHPLLFASLLERRIWARADLDAFLARCASSGNIHLDRRPSYLPVFRASHAMMSDLSTFVLEYPLTGKPLLYLRNPQGSSAEEGMLIGDYCAAGETEADIACFLDAVAEGRDPRAEDRRSAYGKLLHEPAGGAGLAIKNVVDSRLDAELGVPRPALQAV